MPILFDSEVLLISASFLASNCKISKLKAFPLRKAKRTIAEEIPQERGIVT